MARRKTNSEYVKEAESMGIKVIGQYINIVTRIAHQCPSCGRSDWLVKPDNILKGITTKCVRCSHSDSESVNYKERARKLGINVIGKYQGVRVKNST